MRFIITFTRTLTVLLYFCNCVIHILCRFGTNQFRIFCVIAFYIWILHLQYSAQLPVYCLHFQGGLAKKVSYQHVGDLVGTAVWKGPPSALRHLVTKLSFLLLLMNISLKNYINSLLLIFTCRENVYDQWRCSWCAVICDDDWTIRCDDGHLLVRYRHFGKTSCFILQGR
jgi:hypothetical protein